MGRPAARQGDTATVYIGGAPAARQGDVIVEAFGENSIMTGAPTVLIG